MKKYGSAWRAVGVIAAGVWLIVFTAGCATTNSAQIKSIIQSSDDPKFAEAMIAQLKNAGADDTIIREHFALQQKFKEGKLSQREYENAMSKLQIRMDANKVEQEKQRQNNRTALSVLQTVAGVALQLVV